MQNTSSVPLACLLKAMQNTSSVPSLCLPKCNAEHQQCAIALPAHRPPSQIVPIRRQTT
jgi:hypothetical protein